MRHYATTAQPKHCQCEPGRDGAAAHAKPHAKAADHGNLFTRRGNCSHSELMLQTAPMRIRARVRRLQVQ